MTAVAVALGAIIFGAFATEAMTGFGSIILALTFGAMVAPIDELLPVVVPLNLILTGYMVARHRGHVAARLLFITILPLMGLGLIAGQIAGRGLETPALELLLGAVVIGAAARGLWTALRRGGEAPPLSPLAERLWILGAGVIHGLLATGGPALVYALSRSKLDKRAFRSTLACVWLALNSALTVSFLASGSLGAREGARVLAYAPVVAAAIAVGELLHARVDEARFRTVVFALLLVAGLVLCVT